MASGDVVGSILATIPPEAATARAEPGTVAGGSDLTPVLRYDGTTAEAYNLLCALEGYAGGGLTLSLVSATEATPNGTVSWRAAIRRMNAGEDITGTHTYAYQSATASQAPGTGQLVYTDLTFTDGAQMDSLGDGERFMLRVERVAPDSQTGVVDLVWPAIVIKES